MFEGCKKVLRRKVIIFCCEMKIGPEKHNRELITCQLLNDSNYPVAETPSALARVGREFCRVVHNCSNAFLRVVHGSRKHVQRIQHKSSGRYIDGQLTRLKFG